MKDVFQILFVGEAVIPKIYSSWHTTFDQYPNYKDLVFEQGDQLQLRFMISHIHILIFWCVAISVDSWVRWRAVFQSGSRVLKKVFWTFSVYIYGIQCDIMQKSR